MSEPTSSANSSAPISENASLGMSEIEKQHQLLAEISQRGFFGRMKGYISLSGPGWLQSAITLGGGSLAGSLFLGVIAGYSMMWVQPLAMILGIIMLSAIGYITLSTGKRPFQAINEHVNPVLGWGWILAVMAANIVWCLPQYALADSVMQKVLAPTIVGSPDAIQNAKNADKADDAEVGADAGKDDAKAQEVSLIGGMSENPWWIENGGRTVVCLTLFIISLVITWSYDRGGLGLKIYETVLKCIVALIVLSFVGVVIRMTFSKDGLDWAAIMAGFVPDFGQFFRPAATYEPILAAIKNEAARAYWTDLIINKQQDVMIAAAATAVGINMTFLFPYSLLRKGWNADYRGLTIFDLSTGMLIPFVLATSCVVIASASQFHTQPGAGFKFNGEEVTVPGDFAKDYNGLIDSRGKKAKDNNDLPETVSIEEKKMASMLVGRQSQHLAGSLAPLTGDFFAKIVFGFGVVAMTLSTISILMLISGFVFTEMFGGQPGGAVHKLGTLVAGVAGVFGPFVWGDLGFYLAVPTSVIGLILLPLAYITFILLMNSTTMLGEHKPKGIKWLAWNGFMLISASLATVASLYMANKKVADWLGGMEAIDSDMNLYIRVGVLSVIVLLIAFGFVLQRKNRAVTIGDGN